MSCYLCAAIYKEINFPLKRTDYTEGNFWLFHMPGYTPFILGPPVPAVMPNPQMDSELVFRLRPSAKEGAVVSFLIQGWCYKVTVDEVNKYMKCGSEAH